MTAAELRENLLVALDTLRSHKVRSSLTILGIVIGVTSVISVASIIDGLNAYIQNKVESFGARTYFVSRIPLGPRFGRMPEKIRLRKYIQDTDAEFVRGSVCPSVDFVTTFGTRAFFFGDSNDIRYDGNVVERIIIRGAEPEYADAIPLFSVAQRPLHLAIRRRACAHRGGAGRGGRGFAVRPIWIRSARSFGMNGLRVRSDRRLRERSRAVRRSRRGQFAVIPFSHLPQALSRIEGADSGVFGSEGRQSGDGAKDEVIEAMRRLRHVKHNQENDFEITSPDFLSNLWDQLTGALVILTGIISSVGLAGGRHRRDEHHADFGDGAHQ